MKADHTAQIVIAELMSQGNGDVSARLEETNGGHKQNGEYYVEVLSVIADYIKSTHDPRIPILAIPVSVTQDICLDAPDDLKIELPSFECPFIYLHHDTDFLIEADEEYRKVLPPENEFRALYRSWRGIEAAENDWEFENYLFVWLPRPRPN